MHNIGRSAFEEIARVLKNDLTKCKARYAEWGQSDV